MFEGERAVLTAADPGNRRSRHQETDDVPARHRRITRDAVAVALAVGAYGLSYGALAVSAGLSLPQACVLSLLLYSGASQFAYVGVIASGGTALAAVLTSALLGTRNALYGIRLAGLLGVRSVRRGLAAQFVSDESTAMAVAQPSRQAGRFAFWATGIAVFTMWNVTTLLGGLAASRLGSTSLGDPRTLGLDAAMSAAFLALLAPGLKALTPWAVLVAAGGIALVTAPVLPTGLPVLCAVGALLVVPVIGIRSGRPTARRLPDWFSGRSKGCPR